MQQPNILLIMTDQMRGDCLGIAGHPDVKTPYLDSLASQGVWFDHAYSACPSCIAARAALHTGMSGVECNSWVVRPFPYEEKYHPTNWVTDRSIDFLYREMFP